jgi:hypothetical protein
MRIRFGAVPRYFLFDRPLVGRMDIFIKEDPCSD